MPSNAVPISSDMQATALLCLSLSKRGKGQAEPLSLPEYNAVARNVSRLGLRLGALTSAEDLTKIEVRWEGDIEFTRIRRLLGRGAALAFALEHWLGKGVDVCCRADSHYPQALHGLGARAPAILFSFGPLRLLNAPIIGFLGVVSSDNAILGHITELVRSTADKGYVTASAGEHKKRSVVADLLLSEGSLTVVGVPGDIVEFATRPLARDAIAEGHCLLVSATEPGTTANGLNIPLAAELVLAFSRAAVVSSTYIRENPSVYSVMKHALFEEERSRCIVFAEGASMADGIPPWLENTFILSTDTPLDRTWDMIEHGYDWSTVSQAAAGESHRKFEAGNLAEVVPESLQHRNPVLAAVLPLLCEALAEPRSAAELASILMVQKGQMDKWLAEADEVGIVQKGGRPRRYSLRSQLELGFDYQA